MVLRLRASGSACSSAAWQASRGRGPGTRSFILCATDAYGQSSRHRNHAELFRHMFLHDQLGARLTGARSLREVHGLLHGYPLMGDFMSCQTSIDLNYSALIDFSENDFTQAGPGALRGIRRCFDDLGDYTPAEMHPYRCRGPHLYLPCTWPGSQRRPAI
ncbi:MAG TPA: nucleotide kinase domain-containing protein [Streptosporangiaceae bacterium]|nr:nucleotide kinase domain-containing protein [Streptosporangiaceae bacterium]